MKLKQLAINLAVVPALIGLSFTAYNLQAEEKVKRVEIHVEQENDKDALVELIVDGAVEKFTLEDLANGETRSIVTESGKTITATKDENGATTISINGEEIKLFDFRGDMSSNFNVFHTKDKHFNFKFDDKIMVFGGNLSDEVKAALKATLQSHNVDKEVVFADDSHSNMMFISKEVLHPGDEEVDIEIKDGQNVKIIKRIEKK